MQITLPNFNPKMTTVTCSFREKRLPTLIMTTIYNLFISNQELPDDANLPSKGVCIALSLSFTIKIISTFIVICQHRLHYVFIFSHCAQCISNIHVYLCHLQIKHRVLISSTLSTSRTDLFLSNLTFFLSERNPRYIYALR